MIVKIRDAKNGMVLSEPVRDAVGRVLLTSGEELTDRHIAKLSQWGIQTVTVRSADEESTRTAAYVGVDAGDVRRLEERLDLVFGDCKGQPLMRDLRKLVQDHLVQNPEVFHLLKLGREA